MVRLVETKCQWIVVNNIDKRPFILEETSTGHDLDNISLEYFEP